LPIYLSPAGVLPVRRDQPLAGVLMILFTAAHTFQDGEIRTYRLMAGLIETAMSQGGEAEWKAPSPVSVLPTAVPIGFEKRAPFSGRSSPDVGPVFYNGSTDVTYERCKTALASVRKSAAFRRSSALAEVAVQRATESISSNPLRGLAVAAVVIGLGLTLWLSHGTAGPASRSNSNAVQGSGTPNGLQRGEVLPVGEAVELSTTTEKRPTLAAAHVRHSLAASVEIEYIGDDVTVRHFTHKPSPQRQPAAGRVAYIGNDVTVRYFAPKPAISSPTQ
jgi:hypothetical protein